ncbi:MAG: flagellar motor switch protein FliG [Polyangiaceae bacterium]
MAEQIELTGPEKAVLMLLSLEEGVATPIMAELSADEVKRLREAASKMRAVPSTALDQVYSEFITRTREEVAVPRGGMRYLRRIATRALGEAQTDAIFSGSPASAMERIAHTDSNALGALLENEHPQLVAAILSQLDVQKAAEVVEALPEEARAPVLLRLGSMTEVPETLLEDIAEAITSELPAGEAEIALSVDGIGRSAQLVRNLSKETSEALLGDIETENEILAGEIRRAMYSFEDLKAVDQRALRDLLKAVPGDRLTLALKTASEELKNHLFTSMSKRAADLIREDLEMLGGVRLSEVEAAQREIVDVALRLEAEGTISLGGGDDAIV